MTAGYCLWAVSTLHAPIATALPNDDSPRLPSTGRLVRRSAMLLGGFAIAGAFCDFDAWPLAWLGLVPLFAFAPTAASPGTAFFEGWLMGLATNVPAFAWLAETIHRFGGFPWPVAVAFYALLSAYSALQFAGVALVLQWAGPRASPLLAPLLWTAGEVVFPNLFPWRLAHSQLEIVPLLQIGELTGPFGLSFAMAWMAGGLAGARRRPSGLILPSALVLVIALYGGIRMSALRATIESAPSFRVGIVQGNLSLDDKRQVNSFASNIERYRELSERLVPPPDLIVWPETVVEWGIPQEATSLANFDPYPDAPSPLLFGALSYREGPSHLRSDEQWFNSAFLRNRDASIGGRYDKIILMPFGEFLPFARYFPGLRALSPQSGDFSAGDRPGVLRVNDLVRVAPLICYEDLVAELARQATRAGASLLVTLANDAWFGDSVALRQHEALALWRAIENRRYLVRSTNSGLSSVIDPLGRSVAALRTQREAGLVAVVRPLETPTFYQEHGNLFGLAVVLALPLLLIAAHRARGSKLA